MINLTSCRPVSQETQATEARGTKTGTAPEQLVELGIASENTRAFAMAGVFEDGVMTPLGPLYKPYG
jgi:hypothetical protein